MKLLVTGSADNTHVSLVPSPRCSAIAGASRDIETRVRPHNFRAIDAASREYQSVKLTGTLNFSVDGQQADDLYTLVAVRNTLRVIGRGCRPAPVHAGVVDSVTSSWPTYSWPRVAI